MKKSKLLGWAFMALASITSCSDETEVLTQESEIKLTSEITPSRVTSLDYQSTQIVAGQQVGVTITGATTSHNNVVWNVGENGALTNTGNAVYYGAGDATITAYHPYNSASSSYTFSVNTDQSSEENYRNSDLLWATAASSKTENAVPLAFTHELAKINVTLVPEENTMDLSGATISICNTKISTTFNPTTGAISDASGDPQEIKAGVTTADAKTASAIVVPQTVSSGSQFIKIVLGEKIFYYTLSAGKELKSGYSHNYTLTVKEQKVEVKGDSEIADWTDEEEATGAAEEIASIKVTLLSAGTLNQYITNENINSITSLTILGEINGDDVRLFRSIPNLMYLNLNSASIVEGGRNFLDYEDSFDGFTYPNNTGGIGKWTEDKYTKNSSIDHMFIGMKQLTEIILPSNLQYLGSLAFYGCSNLKTIILPKTINFEQSWLDCDSFFSCSSLETIIVEEGNVNMKSENNCLIITYNDLKSLAAIPCALKEFTIPSDIQHITSYAFPEDCRIETLTLLENSPQLDPYYFDKFIYLKNIYANNNLYTSLEGVLYSKDNKTIICYPSGRNSDTYIINKDVTVIGDGCFNTSVYLETMILHEGIETLGQQSFSDCTMLKEITLPSTLREIGNAAFQHCNSLKKIICKATTPPVIPDEYVFLMDELENTELYVPSESLELYKSADYWKEFGDNIKIIGY